MEESTATTPRPTRRLEVPAWARSASARLVWLVVLAVAAVVGTTFLNRAFENMQLATARTWYERGMKALGTGQADTAVADLQSALAHDRDNREYRMRLAQALAAAGKTSQARAYFLNLWQSEPGSGELNLQLARIAARENEPQAAEQFYHGAIFGVWEADGAGRRLVARQELIQFLLARNQTQQAEAEIVALAGDIPDDAAHRQEVGELFLRTGNVQRAFEEFRQAARLDPHAAAASAAAGKTALQLGDFPQARSYLERAVRLESSDQESHELLQRVLMVEAVNPFDPRLRYSERMARAMRAFAIAGRRLQDCNLGAAANSGLLQDQLANWNALKPRVTRTGLRGNPDLAETAANLALEIERETAQLCGQPAGEDLALLLIAQNRGKR